MNIPGEVIRTIEETMEKRQAPFYLYQSELIRERCRMFRAIPYPDTSIHYATMANINQEFLEIVRSEGLFVFVNSLLHLQEEKQAGFEEQHIAFTSSAMDEDLIRLLVASDIQVNLDSINQYNLWKRISPGKPVGIRCNIGELVESRSTRAGYFIGKNSRLGLTIPEIFSLQGERQIAGLHIYVGTDISDMDYFLGCYRALSRFAGGFPALEYLNFGGGFGIRENGESFFPIPEYGEKVSELMEQISREGGRRYRMLLEPGRIIGGDAAYFVTRVNDIKERNGHRFIGVNASSVQFPRPLMYPDSARHPVVILREGRQLDPDTGILGSIYGCSTYSRDYFTRDQHLPSPRIGDLVVFGNAGAYSSSMFTQFLGFQKPEEIFI